MIEAVNIHKTYDNSGKKLTVLKGINLHIDKARFVALVGPSGAGKSTLLHIMGGLDNPSSGHLKIEGRDIYAASEQQLARMRNSQIGFVFQFYHLLSEFTVIENVLIPAMLRQANSAQANKYAHELLDKAGLSRRLQHFPSQLSGGEQQRVALVRALINRPKLLLCDEPTGNLDSETGSHILALIRSIHKESAMTTVMVTHNMELAKSADQIYQLKDGALLN